MTTGVFDEKSTEKVLRAEQDWTQAQLAHALGVSRQTVNAIETGQFDPSLPLAFKAARRFELTIEEIFFDEPESQLRVGSWKTAIIRSSIELSTTHAPAWATTKRFSLEDRHG